MNKHPQKYIKKKRTPKEDLVKFEFIVYDKNEKKMFKNLNKIFKLQ